MGQQAYIDVTAASTVPLMIAAGDLQKYRISLLGGSQSAVGKIDSLLPNNTSYTDCFWIYEEEYRTINTATNAGQYATTQFGNGFFISRYNAVSSWEAVASTSTNIKTFTLTQGYSVQGTFVGGMTLFSLWCSAASNAATADTTTPWTSLGTLVFGNPITGRIIVERLN